MSERRVNSEGVILDYPTDAKLTSEKAKPPDDAPPAYDINLDIKLQEQIREHFAAEDRARAKAAAPVHGANGRDADAPHKVPQPPIDWAALTGDPPPRTWWIPDWLTPEPTLCAGGGGIGKSLLTQAICTALATQKEYLAATIKPLTCLIWSCEDDKNEIWRRQAAINQHFGVALEDLVGRLHIVPRVGLDNTLLDLLHGKPFCTSLMTGELREQVNDLKADVLVLDNAAQMFGGNGNDQHHVTLFVNATRGLVTGRAFAPIITGHVARTQGSEFSGSAAWENACRMRWYLGANLPDKKLDEDEPVDPETVYLSRRKANYTSKDWRRLRFSNGLFVPEQPDRCIGLGQAFRNDTADRVVLTAFNKLLVMGIKPSDKPQAGDYLPGQILSKGLHQNHSKTELRAAMNRLSSAFEHGRAAAGRHFD